MPRFAISITIAVYAIGVAVIFIVSVLYLSGSFRVAQEKIFDHFFITLPPEPGIVILAIDNESIVRVGQWPWPRKVFAEIIAELQTAQAIGIDVTFSELSGVGPADDAALSEALRQSIPRVVLAAVVDQKTRHIQEPLPLFQKYAEMGNVRIYLDADGIVRKMRDAGLPFPLFAAQVAGEGIVSPPETRISYRGPAKTFLTLPVIEILDKKVPPDIFKDAIVLIGVTAEDLHDFAGTPFGTMPGVEIQANSVNTLRNKEFFTDLPRLWGTILISLASLLVLLCIIYLRSFVLLALSLGGVGVLIFVGALTAFSFYIIIPVLYEFLGALGTGFFGIAFQYIATSKEKRFIKKSFTHYLSETIIDAMIQDPSMLALGGERKKVAMLFSDIRGFTTLSEQLSPEELMHKLNEYLTEMSDIVMANRGLVDKYIGDAVMAFWGAPLPNELQAKDACTSVLQMVKALEKLNTHWREHGFQTLEIGVGLNTGNVLVGNLGSKQRFNYTVMGDEVNFCSRLEGLNKAYGTTCIVSESIKKEVEHDTSFIFRELDKVRVKGKKEPKVIYEFIVKDIDCEFGKVLAHFSRGREYYRAGKWPRAIKEFELALAIQDDGPSKVFLERSRTLRKNPPRAWNGVYEFNTK